MVYNIKLQHYNIKISAIWTFPNLRLYLKAKYFLLKLYASCQPIVLFKMQLNPKEYAKSENKGSSCFKGNFKVYINEYR